MISNIKLSANDFQPGKKYIYALSGGIDSMVLLDLLIRKYLNPSQVKIVHVNHNLRAESLYEKEFIKKYCSEKGLECSIKTIAPEFWQTNNFNLEARARTKRYELLLNELKAESADKIITAHHQDDQIETIQLNYLRGCGLAGLAGMSTVKGKILRPLLKVSKAQIREYQQTHNLPFFEDHTNLDEKLLRNYIRINHNNHLNIESKREILSLGDLARNQYLSKLLDLGLVITHINSNYVSISKKWFCLKNDHTQSQIIHLLTQKTSLCRKKTIAEIQAAINSNKSGQTYKTKDLVLYIGTESISLIDKAYWDKTKSKPQTIHKFDPAKLSSSIEVSWLNQKWRITQTEAIYKIPLVCKNSAVTIEPLKSGDEIFFNNRLRNVNRHCKKYKIDLLSRRESFVIKQRNLVMAIPQLNLIAEPPLPIETHCYFQVTTLN